MMIEKTHDGALIVHDAEPLEFFSRELLVQVAHGDSDDGVSLDGGILTIAASNGTWRYRVEWWCSQTSKGTLLEAPVVGEIVGVECPSR